MTREFSAKIALHLLLFASVLFCDSGAAQSNSEDTLILKNELIELQLLRSGKDLIPVKLINLKTGEAIVSHKNSPLGRLPVDANSPKKTSVLRQSIKATARTEAYERLTHSASFEQYEIRQHIDLLADLPIWVHRIEIKLREPLKSISSQSAETKEMIEAAELLQTEGIAYSLFPFIGEHYSVEATRFQDATDHHSNPIQVDRYMAYTKKATIEGNVFILESGRNGHRHFALKESPISQSQVNWPGYDAAILPGSFEVHGPGFDRELTGMWQSAYNVVYGTFAKSKNELYELLLRYKLAQYRYLPEYDNTFTLNTWGDRNRDSRVSESFILEELEAADRLGVTHYQIDDGWQAGLSRNSAESAGENWESWTYDDWQPHPARFPNGLTPVALKADSLGMELGLWYNPGDAKAYSDTSLHLSIWRQYHKRNNVRLFKIDGVNLGSKIAEKELQSLLHEAQISHPDIVFNMDVTAGTRGGYHFMDRYGSIFLENRYTDWGNYFPHLTLRNAWLLGHYVPIQRIQLSFLNKWRNSDKYDETGLEPDSYNFDYLFAITMMGQPLAWMEATGLPDEAFQIAELIKLWKSHRNDWNQVPIIPVGEEPSGYGFCGFVAQSIDGKQYFLLFREKSEEDTYFFNWPCEIPNGAKVQVLYESSSSEIEVDSSGLQLQLKTPGSFTWGYLK